MEDNPTWGRQSPTSIERRVRNDRGTGGWASLIRDHAPAGAYWQLLIKSIERLSFRNAHQARLVLLRGVLAGPTFPQAAKNEWLAMISGVRPDRQVATKQFLPDLHQGGREMRHRKDAVAKVEAHLD